MSDLGLFVPGDSLIHRVPAWVKLLTLIAIGVCSILLSSVATVIIALALSFVLYAVAGFGPGTALRQVRPLMWFLVFIVIVQAWTRGWQSAVVVAGVICLLVMIAALVTLTTRTSELADAVVAACRPLRPFGVDPDRVGLLIALGIRAVPIVSGFAREVRDAQRARGLGASPRAFAAPLLVRALRHADAMGDALIARGVE